MYGLKNKKKTANKLSPPFGHIRLKGKVSLFLI